MALSTDVTKVFGKPTPPPGISVYNSTTGYGVFFLISNLIKVAIFVAGVYSLVNLLLSGIQYVGSAGKPEVLKTASSRIWMSIMGFAIVGASLLIGALLGLIFFKDPTALIKPNLPSPR